MIGVLRQRWPSLHPAKFFSCALWLMLVAGLLASGCGRVAEETLVLNDFETDADLDRVHWACRQLYSLSTQHAASGSHSLQMQLFPADYPGLVLKLSHRDWRGYDAIAFDVFNPHPEALEITVRIDDRPGHPGYEERYNKPFTIAPGGNAIRIPLETLSTSGGDRRLDLSRIHRFMFFLVDSRELRTLYVDHIRVEAPRPG